MNKAELSQNQILLLARQWDLNGMPQEEVAQGFIFEAMGGYRLLRVVPMQEAAFCHFLQKYLYNRGFARGLRFIPNKYGDAYGIWQDYGIYLCDYYPKGAYHLESEYDLLRLAGLLGEFHNAATGFFIPGAPLEKFTSPVEYAFWLTEQPPPPMTVHMLPIYDRIRELAQKALEHADDENLKILCEQVIAQGLVIHGRFNETAVSENYSELLITDYSNSSYGLPVWDLAYLLNKGLLQLGKDKSILSGAVSEYEKRRKLSKEEKTMLNKFLSLPMEFLFAIQDWQEQNLTGEGFAEILIAEENILSLREGYLRF